jgi:hypothetical protein
MGSLPDLNFPAFHTEAARLRALGYDVVNPAEINPDPTTPREECLKRDIAALLTCDEIAVLPGWRFSEGASLEVEIARATGLGFRYSHGIIK